MINRQSVILLGWCQSVECGEPIRGQVGQRCPKFCLPCAIQQQTGQKAPQRSSDDPGELILGGSDYRTLRDTSEEDNQD